MISTKNKILVFVLMAAGFIGSLSQNLLTSALPSILTDFGISAAIGQWLTTSYILVMGVITALTAFLFYKFETKLLVQVSLSIFLAGCILSLLAPNFPLLLAGRIIQACGAGPLIPLLQTAVLYLYPPEHQGQALGLTGIIVGFAPAVGPTLSGLLVDAFGWRSIFIFLIIFTCLIMLLGQFSLQSIGERQNLSLDGISVILYTLGFSTFMLAVTFLKSGVILSAKVLLTFAIGIISLAVFVKRQNSSTAPLLKLSLLRDRSLMMGTILLGIAYVMNMAGTILVPLFNQSICPYSATVSGLILLPGSLLIAAFSPYSGKLKDRYGAKRICLIGMFFMLAGNLPFMFFTETVGILPIVIAYASRCMGMTFLMTPSTALAVQDLKLEDKPYGMAILNSLRQMSGSLFSTILVVIATIASAPASLSVTGIHVAFATMVGFSIVGIFLTMAISQKNS